MADDDERRRAEILGAIDERTKGISTRLEKVETKLDTMSSSFVTRPEWTVWRAIFASIGGAIVIGLMYALFSGNIHFGH